MITESTLERLRPRLLAYVKAMTSGMRASWDQEQHAEDICQLSIIRAWKYRKTCQEGRDELRWLCSIAHRVYMGVRDKETRLTKCSWDHLDTMDADLVDIIGAEDEVLAEEDEAERFRLAQAVALSFQSPETRRLAVLVAAAGDLSEAALILGISTRAAYVRLQRASNLNRKELVNG